MDGVQRGRGVRHSARGPGLLARENLARCVRLLPDQGVLGGGQHRDGGDDEVTDNYQLHPHYQHQSTADRSQYHSDQYLFSMFVIFSLSTNNPITQAARSMNFAFSSQKSSVFFAKSCNIGPVSQVS